MKKYKLFPVLSCKRWSLDTHVYNYHKNFICSSNIRSYVICIVIISLTVGVCFCVIFNFTWIGKKQYLGFAIHLLAGTERFRKYIDLNLSHCHKAHILWYVAEINFFLKRVLCYFLNN